MTATRVFVTALAASALTMAFDGDTFAAKFDALPKAVQQTAAAQMEHAFPVSITSAKGEHGWDYQVNTRRDGKYHDIVIDENGKLVAVKDEVDLAAVPPPVKAAIEQRAASSKVVTLEKVTENGQVSYAARIRDVEQQALVQVRVTPEGTLAPASENRPPR